MTSVSISVFEKIHKSNDGRNVFAPVRKYLESPDVVSASRLAGRGSK